MTERKQIEDGVLMDHVLFAGRDLETLEEAFTQIGFNPEYGGEHGNMGTHNSLVSFDDGTYVELIALVDPNTEDNEQIHVMKGNAGPCGWALEPENIESMVKEVSDRGFEMSELFSMSRETPAGDLAAWRISLFSENFPGTRLPFLISDTEPRENRVPLTDSVAGSELTGIGAVVVGVENLTEGVNRYRRAFDLPEPNYHTDDEFRASLAQFPGTPVIIASPHGDDSWLVDRITEFGEIPCAFLLATEDMNTSLEKRPLSKETEWFGQHLAWFDLPELNGRFGVID